MTQRRTKWLDRTLVLGPHLCLCTSEEAFNAARKNLKWPDVGPWCSDGGGKAHILFDDTSSVAVVCVEGLTEHDTIRAAGIFAHEAVHIWQAWCLSMGEDAPGSEIEAYAIQNLVVILLDEWVRQVAAG